MGWFWGTSDSPNDSKSEDPLRNLDPSLRDFLKKESPVQYSTTNPPVSKPAPVANPSTSISTSKTTTPAEAVSERPPPPSQFKDGRYAELWKTYRPLAEIEDEAKTDQEKISDVVDAFKKRKVEIGKAALENCALEQVAVSGCFSNGGLVARMTLCRAENKSLRRCHEMQSKFLKALGYLSSLDRPAEVDEQIQMHADTLYHRMLDQEKATEAAKAEGAPIPSFPPLMSSQRPKFAATPAAEAAEKDVSDGLLKPSDLKASIQEKFKERLKGLPPHEREIEERAIKAELRAGESVAQQLDSIYEKQAEELKQRQATGKETVTDRLVSVFRVR